MPSKARMNGEVATIKQQQECNIHRCRFVSYQPPKITALAFSHHSNSEEPIPESLLLAIGRSNGDIDIWSPLNEWVHKITLRGGKDRSIEGLAWAPSPAYQKRASHRLFSIGSSTYLTEWNITTGLAKQHLDSNAGAIWSLAPSPDGKTIALGCEDGTIILVDVADGSFAYSRALERQNARVLSLAWHPNGRFLVGGCADSTIRAWDVNHAYGRIIAQMKVDHGYKKGIKRRRKMDTLVWAVKVLSDGTIVSGDSTGALKFWESKFWSLTQTFQVHKSDILCLTVDDNEEMIFSSGVDRKTMRYRRLQNGKWVHVDGKTYHQHDVRAMASFETSEMRMICSGGVDRSLSVLTFTDRGENLRVLPPVPQERVVKLASESRILLNWSDNHIRLWRVEQITNHEFAGEQIENRYLLEMELNHEENISTAAISPNGEYLLIATLTFIKLFALTPDEATSKLTVEQLGEFPHGARLATFTADGDKIVLVTPDSEVQIHPFLDPDAMTVQLPFSGDRGDYITQIAVSPDGVTFAFASSTSMVVIQSFDPDIPPIMLPQPSSAVTSLTFLTPELISLTLADRNRLLLFEHQDGQWELHPWCKNAENMPAQIVITVDKCLGTFITNNDTSRIWMWGANWLAWIQPDGQKTIQRVPVDPEEGKKEMKKEMILKEEYPHWINYRYREVLLVDCLESTSESIEMVVVERPRHEVLEDITEPRFYRHDFGS